MNSLADYPSFSLSLSVCHSPWGKDDQATKEEGSLREATREDPGSRRTREIPPAFRCNTRYFRLFVTHWIIAQFIRQASVSIIDIYTNFRRKT